MQENVQKPRPEQETSEGAEETAVAPEVDIEEIDDLLDEIDEVLEENAAEFVKNYVQKGGE